MRRREFIRLFGSSVVARPLVARAQHAIPVIGFLSSQSPDGYGPFLAAFRQGLKESGFEEGRNVGIEYRWAHSHFDQLPILAAELVRLRVDVIAATGGLPSALAAKAATTSIPVVFNSGTDPLQAGLVTSINHPGGNVTGVSWFSIDLSAKRLALLHEIAPAATVVAFLTNPKDPELTRQLPAVQDGARALGLRLIVANAATPSEIDTAYDDLMKQGANAVFVASGPFFVNQRAQLVALAMRHGIPCVYVEREATVAGGLVSYGNDLKDSYRRNGLYVARILKGDKPGDLPIDYATKFELTINLKTAKQLGLNIPPTLLARADEVIE
jgi:putative tryptophan/tyrosine transport system substrate-binding protein